MDPASGRNGLCSSALGAIATLAVLIAVPYAVPGLSRLRVLTPLPDGQGLVLAPPPAVSAAPAASVGEAKLAGETGEQAELRQPEVVVIPPSATDAVPA